MASMSGYRKIPWVSDFLMVDTEALLLYRSLAAKIGKDQGHK